MPKTKATKSDKKVKSSGKGEKFADMSATAVVIDEKELEKELQGERVSPSSTKVSEGKKVSKVRGKDYQKVKKMVDQNKKYLLKEALELLKKVSLGKFTGTVEVHLNVVEKGLAGDVNLPHFQAKAKKIVVFNDEVGGTIKSGKIDFDILLASPADMPKILPLAKILGPKGLMPNPKTGTLVPDPQKAVAGFSSTALRFKTEKDFPIIHTVIGKTSQANEELAANFEALIKAVNPKNIKKVVIKSTMSPAIKIYLGQ